MFVNVDDVQASYEGDLEDDSIPWVTRKIEEAENILFGSCSGARLIRDTPEHPKRGLLRDVIVRAVLRVVRDDSPGLNSETLGNYEYHKNALTASGDVWFPDKDLALLGCGKKIRPGSAKVAYSPTYAIPSRHCRGLG